MVSPACSGANRTRSRDDQGVGVRDQAAHDVAVDRGFEIHGAPLPLVLVAAGSGLGVRLAQLERLLGLALESTGPRSSDSGTNANTLPEHLKHGDLTLRTGMSPRSPADRG